jgi:hypothetical protein
MISKNTKAATSIVVSAGVFTFGSAAHGQDYIGPAPQTLLNIATTTSTASSNVSMLMFNPTTFARVEPPPPVIPAGKRVQT